MKISEKKCGYKDRNTKQEKKKKNGQFRFSVMHVSDKNPQVNRNVQTRQEELAPQSLRGNYDFKHV